MGSVERYQLHGIYAGLIGEYAAYKRALGFKMEETEERLARFDRLTIERGETVIGITKELFDQWGKIAPLESNVNRYSRTSILKGFSAYLQLKGYDSYIPKMPPYKSTFKPHIYTRNEISAIFREADKLYCHRRYTKSIKCVMPCLVRLLYSTGIRVGEALKLTHSDVCLDDGTLLLRECKNGTDRLVPMSLSMREIVRDYWTYKQSLGLRCAPEDPFFTSADGAPCTAGTVYQIFRMLVYRAGLPHGGRSKGPRVHDLRHTFCVNALVAMAEAGMDLYTSMPILMTYVGHKSLSATNRYVRITEEMYPKLISKVDETYRYVFPEIGTAPSEIDHNDEDD